MPGASYYSAVRRSFNVPVNNNLKKDVTITIAPVVCWHQLQPFVRVNGHVAYHGHCCFCTDIKSNQDPIDSMFPVLKRLSSRAFM